MAGRFAPPPIVRAYARWRLAVLRTIHRRRSARRFAPSPYAGAEAPRWRPAIPHCNFTIRIPKPATTNPYAPSFVSERIFAFFRHHGPGSLGNLPSRQHAVVRNVRRLSSVISMLPDFSTSCIWATVTPLACCSINRFRNRSSTSARLSFGGTSFANSPSMASKSTSASLKRLAGIVQLPTVSRIRDQARMWSSAIRSSVQIVRALANQNSSHDLLTSPECNTEKIL